MYFLTVCTKDRHPVLWSPEATHASSHADENRLSPIGRVVKEELEKMSSIYQMVHLVKYYIMPDHIHLLLSIDTDCSGRPQVAPTVSRVIKQFKGSVSKQLGHSIWQKSFYDHVIRQEADFLSCWQYIENNPLRYEVM